MKNLIVNDNVFLRQFEVEVGEDLATIEYSLQDRKIFLTKFVENDNEDEELHQEFIKNVLEIAIERKLKVVPTHIKMIKFFRKNRKYQELLPPGLKI